MKINFIRTNSKLCPYKLSSSLGQTFEIIRTKYFSPYCSPPGTFDIPSLHRIFSDYQCFKVGIIEIWFDVEGYYEMTIS
jgi:hypothetical protein